MSKTRDKILDAACQLFNEEGYFQVTVRMIAQKVGISSGNLNYHFATRREILRALYFRMAEVFDERVAGLASQSFTIPYIQNTIKISMERMVAYRFIWTDLFHILKEDEAIKSHFQEVYQKRFQGYQFMFGAMEKAGLFLPESYTGERGEIATRMLVYSDHWLTTIAIYEKESSVQEVDNQANMLLGFLFPYLTEKGRRDYLELINR